MCSVQTWFILLDWWKFEYHEPQIQKLLCFDMSIVPYQNIAFSESAAFQQYDMNINVAPKKDHFCGGTENIY